jgi:hypothetical protein
VGTRVFFSGISEARLKHGLIARYGEVFDRCIALAQMKFPPKRIAKSLAR